MSEELSGKVAIVTGGASGIGLAAVRLFATAGASKVIMADVNGATGEALAAEIGDNVVFQETDVSSETAVQALVDRAVNDFGGLHVMFNNAGISNRLFDSFLDDDLQDFRRTMDVNVLGVMLGTQRAARHMAAHGGGSIINTASIGGAHAGFGVMSYRASKAAVLHFSKCAAIDLAQHNIRVNVINPGHIRTKMASWSDTGMSEAGFNQLQSELDEINLSDQPIKRLGTPEDVAEAALYLASDRSRQVTGIVITVDGGVTAGDCVNHVKQIHDAQARAMKL
ncbi:SDR family oxidoreductase [Mangrovimicrobium sediminis]|uniref:SDR family oxidoreductase n=1 Tax=Mangrovimicrobium sediminis TaxID=2562682 RepID=A0A4Z0M9T2_9GAMM|nr:SDR family oxidoreductase [Haliea sp. SAOS-164]TGD76148.1 SDR family oxidoreductase [Haliea sp. SAOS-164]